MAPEVVVSAIGEAKNTTTDLLRDGRGWILICISLGWFLSHGVRTAFPALVPFLQAEFEVSLTVIGLLLTSLWASYALGQLPGGVLADRIGEGNILTLGLGIAGFAVFLVFSSVSFWMVFLGTIGFGIGTAVYAPARFTVFTDIYEQRDGTAIGITMAAGSLGDVFVPIVATTVASAFAWQWGFAWLVPVFAVLTLITWIVVPARTSGSTSAVDEISWATVGEIRRGIFHGKVPTVLLIHIFVTFITTGMFTFYPTYLTTVKDLSPTTASTLYALFFAVAFFIQPISGSVKDTFGIKLALVIVLSVVTVGLWVLPFTAGIVQLILVTVLLSSIRGFPVISQSYYANELPDDMRGTGLGTIRTGTLLIGASSPIFLGVLGDSGMLTEAYVFLAALATLGLSISALKL